MRPWGPPLSPSPSAPSPAADHLSRGVSPQRQPHVPRHTAQTKGPAVTSLLSVYNLSEVATALGIEPKHLSQSIQPPSHHPLLHAAQLSQHFPQTWDCAHGKKEVLQETQHTYPHRLVRHRFQETLILTIYKP